MDKLINMGVFVGGALAGSYIASNAEVLKTNISMLFVPPGAEHGEEEEEAVECGEGDEEGDDWSCALSMNKSQVSSPCLCFNAQKAPGTILNCTGAAQKRMNGGRPLFVQRDSWTVISFPEHGGSGRRCRSGEALKRPETPDRARER